jgi:hypothetical protein
MAGHTMEHGNLREVTDALLSLIEANLLSKGSVGLLSSATHLADSGLYGYYCTPTSPTPTDNSGKLL